MLLKKVGPTASRALPGLSSRANGGERSRRPALAGASCLQPVKAADTMSQRSGAGIVDGGGCMLCSDAYTSSTWTPPRRRAGPVDSENPPKQQCPQGPAGKLRPAVCGGAAGCMGLPRRQGGRPTASCRSRGGARTRRPRGTGAPTRTRQQEQPAGGAEFGVRLLQHRAKPSPWPGRCRGRSSPARRGGRTGCSFGSRLGRRASCGGGTGTAGSGSTGGEPRQCQRTRRVLYSRRRCGYTNALRTRTSAPIGTAHPLEVARSGANLVAPGSASPRRVGQGHRRGRGVPPTFGLKQNPKGKEKLWPVSQRIAA